MKTTFKSYISMALLTAAASMLSPGCSDENDYYLTPSEDTDGFVLMLPSVTTFDTRAEEYGATANELKYSSLTFFAFPQDDEGEQLSVRLTPQEGSLSLKNTYTSYSIDLKPGKYKFYLTANYFGTTSISSLPQTETDLKAEKIVYESSFTGAIPKKGLPMSCDHSGFHTEEGTPLGASFEVTGNENQTIYADLIFACAKVSVTANDFQGQPTDIASISVGNISQNVPVIYDSSFSGYESIGEKSMSNNTGSSTEETSKTFTFYIPERIVSTENAAQQSSATVKIGEKEVILPLGEPSNVSTDKVNQLPATTDLRAINRGTHYIYTLNAKAEPTLVVEPWTVEKILYNLRGQYFLHLEHTSYPIETGKTTAIWYDSNTKPELESPTYLVNRENKPLYISTIDNDSIYVSVNPDIPTSEYESIREDQEGNYNFFHIKAGNIHKKITVTPLNLVNYLTVTPLNISIDVRELIASGKYYGDFQVIINTNLPQVTIKRADGWSALQELGEWNTGNPSDYVIMLTKEDDSQLTVGENGETLNLEGKSSVKLNLHYSGLNSGKKTWQESRVLTFTVSGEIKNQSGETTTLTQTVTINIIPNIQNYKIHFKADGWSAPHIYVYQCLELPSDVTNSELANKPIATNSTGRTAALEYSFTGKIAFKGWDTSSSYNNPNATILGPVSGFYYFDENENTGSWIAGEGDFTKHYYDDMDFCYDYRNSEYCKCNLCKGNSYFRLWPGIMMKEGSGNSHGWWDFELTGVAEPGKALIMFADGHSNSADINNRFPGKDAVGVPLFDFQDREGWLCFTGMVKDRINNVFSDEKKDLETKPIKCRVYWWKNSPGDDKYRDYILYNDGKGGENTKKQNMGSEGIKKEGEDNEIERFYTDIELSSTFDNRFITACNSNGENWWPAPNWVKLQNEAIPVSREKYGYDYYLILY